MRPADPGVALDRVALSLARAADADARAAAAEEDEADDEAAGVADSCDASGARGARCVARTLPRRIDASSAPDSRGDGLRSDGLDFASADRPADR